MKKRITLFDIINITLLVFLCISVLYPVWNQIVLSFTDSEVTGGLGISLWPEEFSLEAYKYIFEYGNVGRAYVNTIIRTILGTLAIVGVTVLAAYPLSRDDLPFRPMFIVLFIVSMYINGGMIPRYLLNRDLGLLDTRLVLIIPVALNTSYVVILRNFFKGISPEIEESAIMDGASPFQVLTKIVLPLSVPILVTIALWAALYHWNEWFNATIYVRDNSLEVLQSVVRKMLIDVNPARMQEQISGTGAASAKLLLANVRAATVVVSVGPIILVYPFAQKYFVDGLQLGAVKG